MGRVTIFHTSDLHNKLTLEMAQRLHDLKEAHPDSLMFDSGDAIWSGNIYWRPGGEPILDLMNSVPYDALCMGNREYHFLESGLVSKTSRANFPILSANLRVADGSSPDAARAGVGSFINFDCDGKKITVMGLSVPCITERMMVKKLAHYYFEQPIKAAEEIVPRLRDGCDLLIALTHIGIKQDIELAKEVQGIDVLLGGHTHTLAEERVGETLIIHSGFYGHYVRKLEIEFGEEGVDVRSEMIALGKA